MEYVIGIDGGGTKTVAVIADMNGFVIAKSQVGPTNPNVMPVQDLKRTLNKLLHHLRNQAPDPYEHVQTLFAGMSGAGSEQAKRTFEGVFQALAPHIPTICVEIDTINALYSGTYGGPGIVQIAGTGAITYGINRIGKHDRVGGWGYLFGDEGSGYDIGRRGVIAALKHVDGRGPETALLRLLYTHFEVATPRDLIEKIYEASSPKMEIAPLSKIVFEAYKKQDLIAKEILYDVAKEMGISIRTLYAKLFPTNEDVNVVLCGGVFSDKDVIPSFISSQLQEYGNIKVIVPEVPPVGGSIIGAYIIQNRNLDSKIIESIRKTI